MECKEVNNLIIESGTIESILEDNDVKLHIESCNSCREKLEFEKKFRKSFDSISLQEPPIEISKMILSIPKQENPEVALIDKLRDLVLSFKFKASFASFIIGFIVALAITNNNNPGLIQKAIPVSQPQEIAKKQKLILYRTKTEKSDKSEKSRDKSAISDTNNVEKKQKNLTSEIAKKPLSRRARPTSKAFYSIAENPLDWKEKNSAKQQLSKQIARAENITPSSDEFAPNPPEPLAQPRAKLAMAPSLLLRISERKKMSEKSVVGRVVPLKSKTRLNTMLDRNNTDARDLVNTKDSPVDARNIEIEKILRSHNLKFKGFLNLKSLVVRGIITSETYSKLAPPQGRAWYSQIVNNRVKVSLRKQK